MVQPYVHLRQIATPQGKPRNGGNLLYTKSDNGLYLLDADGTEHEVGAGGGGAVDSVVAGDQITVDATDPSNPVVSTTGLLESVVAGTNVTIDNTDPLNPIISASGSGGGGGNTNVWLIDKGDDPASYSPSVGDIFIEKAGIPPSTTWDFRGASSLADFPGWQRSGGLTETFNASGMTSTYDPAGENHYYDFGTPIADGTFETKLVTATAGPVMIGPQIYDSASSLGVCTSWYTGPAGALLLSINSGHTYGGTFANAGGTPGTYPVWFRVRRSGGNVYGSYSLDGSTWSSEATFALGMTQVTQVALGGIFQAPLTATWEYAKWTPATSLSGGLLGWWDGSDLVSFD